MVQFHSFACDCPVFPTPFIEKNYTLPHWKSFEHICKGLFLGSLFYSIVYMSVFMPVPHGFDYCSLILLVLELYRILLFVFLRILFLLFGIERCIYIIAYSSSFYWSMVFNCPKSIHSTAGEYLILSPNIFWKGIAATWSHWL